MIKLNRRSLFQAVAAAIASRPALALPAPKPVAVAPKIIGHILAETIQGIVNPGVTPELRKSVYAAFINSELFDGCYIQSLRIQEDGRITDVVLIAARRT